MHEFEGCQLPCLPNVAHGKATFEAQPLTVRLKRNLASPWNYKIKPLVKRWERKRGLLRSQFTANSPVSGSPSSLAAPTRLEAGDSVRVRSREEIEATLDSWNEFKGCAFLDNMWQYCDTEQRVLKRMERFLDERDYKVKRCKGLLLLEGVLCEGTPVFGRCDRCCHLFWREEWLAKTDSYQGQRGGG